MRQDAAAATNLAAVVEPRDPDVDEQVAPFDLLDQLPQGGAVGGSLPGCTG
jgi:hypothetical protein